MKKIMFYTMGMTSGGAEKVISELANYFINSNDVLLVTNHNSKSNYKLDKRIKYLNLDNKNKLDEKIYKKIITKISRYRTKRLKEIIAKERPKCIVAFLPEPTIRLLKLRKKYPDIKFIVSIRNHPTKEFRFLKFLRNHYYKMADKIVIQSKSYKKYLPKYLSKKVEIIPNPINKIKVRSNKKEKKIVNAGRLCKQKNQMLLLKAFKMLNDKDYHLEIYGNGKYKKKLDKYIKKNNLQKRVSIITNEKEIYDKISNASLFVLSSNYEGMPNTILESLALNIPVVSTRSTEVIEELLDNKYIVECNNPIKLKDKIEEVLKSNSYVTKKLFNSDEVYQKWNDIFK
ncbi:MAG: glycosyltransferase [Bacilli bacterium]|nr:glycosyltransferase [Bacilli bacterium]